MIKSFFELTRDQQLAAGGKGGTLARLAQAGYPVPDGFLILPSAFADDQLTESAWAQTREKLAALRTHNGRTAFAVRSSALSEDSAQASFAGEFETVLDVKSDAEVQGAIQMVRNSRTAARVQAYSAAQGLRAEHEIAVVVQKMVRAEFSGVLFTADPVTGSYTAMTGNFVRGLGDKLVSGESDGVPFALNRPNGKYKGPAELKRFARALFRLASRLESDLGGPQDIEWAIGDGKLHLLQSRPITTLRGHNAAAGDWNTSLTGDYLWTNSNFGEAVPDVMTPLTWSLLQIYFDVVMPFSIPGNHPFAGNIGGRFYLNLSLLASFAAALGFSREQLNYESEEFFGRLPENAEIPIVPFSRWGLLRRAIPIAFSARRRVAANQKRLPQFLAEAPDRLDSLRARIRSASSAQELANLWRNDLEPFYREACQMLQAGTSRYENTARPLRRDLKKLIGEVDANTLMTGLSSANSPLASLAPLLGLAKVARGELSRAEYDRRYGHRGPHEFEVSRPRPAEDPAWIDQQLANLHQTDVKSLLARQQAERKAVWKQFENRYPRQTKAMQKRLAVAAEAARGREAIRSEIIRIIWGVREFALRAGELTGFGDGIFFLSAAELVNVLNGDKSVAALIPGRRETYARYRALPPYPALISGRFDPFRWAADPDRRSDVFDAHRDSRSAVNPSSLIKGFPGAAGVIEGSVRVLGSSEEGSQLQAGEILVTTTTNVGWTPLFPRAAAVITDVGAPLSHAAIVARELGIPAVVGCGNATMRLHTGDRVRVNGGFGTVEIL